jgi:multidrug efflux system membrane fusion protein
MASAIAVSLLATACTTKNAETEKAPKAVRVVALEGSDGALESRYSGTLEAATKVDAAFRIGGYVESLAQVGEGKSKRTLDVGDFVKKGTVLGKIRSADYAQKVASAKARTAEARASAKLAEQDLGRAKRLYDTSVITKAELEAKTAQLEAADAAVTGAVAQVSEASLALGDTVLTAPMDGVVLARRVEEGSLVNPGTVAFVIADVRNVKAVFGAPQALVQRLAVGDRVTVTSGSGGESTGPAFNVPVTRIAPAADANGRLFTVESLIPNADGGLRPGSVVTIRVPAAARAPGALVVPLGAVIRSPRDPRGFSVFIIEGDAPSGPARLRDVELGEVVGNGVAVTNGLALGERVVTTGASLLSDGSEAVVIP